MSEDDELRLYCVMRADLEAPTGKLMAQAGHAFVSALEATRKLHDGPAIIDQYMTNGQPKIVVRARNEAVLRKAADACSQAGIPCYLVIDAGRTVFPEPTMTCLGIGPVTRDGLPKFVRNLQLFA
jgi:PTH2 family peptidyl-tRNA hydrolase